MHTRGRYSAAALSVVTPDGPREVLQPPAYFNAREMKEWDAIVGRLGAEFFPQECRALLVNFISISVSLEDINRELSRFDKGLPKSKQLKSSYSELTKLRASLIGPALSLATKLRLAPSTRNDRDRTTKRVARPGPRPWEAEFETDLDS